MIADQYELPPQEKVRLIWKTYSRISALVVATYPPTVSLGGYGRPGYVGSAISLAVMLGNSVGKDPVVAEPVAYVLSKHGLQVYDSSVISMVTGIDNITNNLLTLGL